MGLFWGVGLILVGGVVLFNILVYTVRVFGFTLCVCFFGVF